MDLFLPETSRRPVPCVIVIQGGGFRAQERGRFRPFAVYLAGHGFAAAMIDYRGRPDHEYQSTIADTRTAVRYIRKISKNYNIDPDRIGAMGRSAGATLAVLLAVTGGVEEFPGDEDRFQQFSVRIQAAVAYAGVYDNEPPVLFLHCKDDPVVPWQQSRDMYDVMKQSGIDAEIRYYETGGHGFRLHDPEKPMEEMIRFFKKTL